MRAERLREQDLVPEEASVRVRSGAARPSGNSQRDSRVTGLEPAESSLGEGRGCPRPAARGSALHLGSSRPAEFCSRQSPAHTQPRNAALHWERMLDHIPPSLLLVRMGKLRFRGGVSAPALTNGLPRAQCAGAAREEFLCICFSRSHLDKLTLEAPV